MLLERLRLPLALAEAACEGCGRTLDIRGGHRAACRDSGRWKRRALPVEQAMARICREAGATVRTNAMLKDMNVGVPAADGRKLEILAQGLPCRFGKQLAVDVTLRHVLSADGDVKPRAAAVDGIVAAAARRDKEDTYPELAHGFRSSLVIVALETGGRWSSEAADFVEELAFARAREAPRLSRFATALAWQRRWVRILSTAAANAFARSLVAPAGDLAACTFDGGPPELCDLFARGW